MDINKIKKIPIFLYSIIIFILSSFPQDISFGGGLDKYRLKILLLFHIGEFGLYSMLLMLAYFPQISKLVLCQFSMLYGVFDEIHQYLVPGRKFDIKDIIANMIGAILGILIYLVLFKIFKKIRYKNCFYCEKLFLKKRLHCYYINYVSGYDGYPIFICDCCQKHYI